MSFTYFAPRRRAKPCFWQFQIGKGVIVTVPRFTFPLDDCPPSPSPRTNGIKSNNALIIHEMSSYSTRTFPYIYIPRYIKTGHDRYLFPVTHSATRQIKLQRTLSIRDEQSGDLPLKDTANCPWRDCRESPIIDAGPPTLSLAILLQQRNTPKRKIALFAHRSRTLTSVLFFT